jgi:DNA-binding transcriptional LysR family regulator
MINEQDIKYFIEIAHSLNITRASERLGVTQPTLTQALGRLERELDSELFHRSKKGVHLTKAGERLLASSQQLLMEWEKIFAAVKNSELQVTGRYKLGVHSAVARYTLPVFLKDLLQENPQLEIHLRHDLSRKIAEEVISWKLDLGLVINPPPHPDLVIKTLCEDVVTLWCSGEDHVKDDLICEPDLLQTQSILEKLGKKGFHFKRTLHSSSLEVITSLVHEGCGVGILPERVVKSDGKAKIRRLSADAPVFKDKLCLIYRADTRNNAATRMIINHILKAKF